MKKVYFMFLTPLFLYSQNLEELVNLSINNKMVNASQQSLDSIKDEYKSIQSGYLPSLDVGVFQRIQQKLMQHLVMSFMMVGKSMILMIAMNQL